MTVQQPGKQHHSSKEPIDSAIYITIGKTGQTPDIDQLNEKNRIVKCLFLTAPMPSLI